MTIRGLLTCLMDMSGSLKVITLSTFWKTDLETVEGPGVTSYTLELL